jgi:hypothetical protein
MGYDLVTRERPGRAGRIGADCGSALTSTIASVVTITIVNAVKNVSTVCEPLKPEP